MDLLIRLLIWLLRELFQAATADGQGQGSAAVSTETEEQYLLRELSRITQRLPAVEASARQQLTELATDKPDLQARLVPVLEDGVLAQMEPLAEERRAIRRTVAEAGAEAALEPAKSYATHVQRLQVLVQVTQEMIRQRRSETDRALLGDADALAAACYRPILDFANQNQLPIRSNHPLTVFYPGGTFIELSFLDQQLAPIGLPDRFHTEPWWWPSVAHEIAHDFYFSLPDLEPELISKLDLDVTGESAGPPGSAEFNRLLFRVWLAEIFADAVGALMIGPAYLRAMAAIFKSPQAPEEVVSIHFSQSGIDVHPPRHLRVHMTARFLERMGFGSRAMDLVRSWDQEHGEPQAAILVWPTGDEHAVPLLPMLELGNEVTDQLYHAELQSLDGHRLADIPGLDFSSTHYRRGEKARQELAAGHPVAFDARALIAGATEAALDEPERIDDINRATRLSIVGVGTGERPARVRALAQASRMRAARLGGGMPAPARVVEALLLAEILESRPRGRGVRFRAAGRTAG